ncbi:hypothetical protein [Streptomyces sp. NPDC046939]|uniref:hypothetical protein n=1 Tax=Streptomyces sp. NPDC046939 TaxID=3155376 RepID=UPI0033F12D83
MPGARPEHTSPPQTETRYILHEDGALFRFTLQGGTEPPPLPDGAQWVTQAAYEEARAAMQERHEAQVAGRQAAEAATQRAHFDALLAAGNAEATARALSGYAGPVTDPSDR